MRVQKLSKKAAKVNSVHSKCATLCFDMHNFVVLAQKKSQVSISLFIDMTKRQRIFIIIRKSTLRVNEGMKSTFKISRGKTYLMLNVT